MSAYDAIREHLKDIFDNWKNDISDEDVGDLHVAMSSYYDEETEFKLYRYIPMNYYNIRNIETGMIHLSNIGLFNDAYEGIPVSAYSSLSGKQKSALSMMANVVCFSESFDNNLMWSHYADSHRGLCVEYDIKRLSDKNTIRKIFPVLYDGERISNCELNKLADDLIELWDDLDKGYEHAEGPYLRSIMPLLLKKNEIWNYEREWRLIYTLPQYYDDYGSNSQWTNLLLNFDCITAVYCGVRCDPTVVKNLDEIRKRQETPFRLYRSNLSVDSYGIEFEED